MRRIGRVLAICALFAALIGAIVYVGFDIAGRASLMQLAQTDATVYKAARPGQPIKAVLQIEAREGATGVTGHLLRPVTETAYRKTSTPIRALIEPSVRVIMGTTDDLKPGAVAQFDGIADGRGAIRVRRIVILSAYIHVVES
jgi:hypothetical protein